MPLDTLKQQISKLQAEEKLVFLVGRPGSGKSIFCRLSIIIILT